MEMGSSSLMNAMIVGSRDEMVLALRIDDLTEGRHMNTRFDLSSWLSSALIPDPL